MSSYGTALRDLLSTADLLRAPGAYDGISAHLVRQAGFSAVYGDVRQLTMGGSPGINDSANPSIQKF